MAGLFPDRLYIYIHTHSGKTDGLKIVVGKSFFSQRLLWGNILLRGKKNNSEPKPFT